MLCGRFPVSRDFNGIIFIDRAPKLFRWVLNYLRDETLSPPKDHDKVEALLAEARYFQLPDMERLLQDAWGQQCVLTYYANPPNGLVHTLHVDGPLDVIKGIRSAVSSVRPPPAPAALSSPLSSRLLIKEKSPRHFCLRLLCGS